MLLSYLSGLDHPLDAEELRSRKGSVSTDPITRFGGRLSGPRSLVDSHQRSASLSYAAMCFSRRRPVPDPLQASTGDLPLAVG